MSTEREPKQKPEVNRRRLGRLGKVALAATMLTGVGAQPVSSAESNQVQQIPSADLMEHDRGEVGAEKLRTKIKENGDKKLTFEESVELIPRIADFYVENINTDLSPEIITENSYVVTGKITEEDLLFVRENAMSINFIRGLGVDFTDSPLFKRMKADYPNLRIGDQIDATSFASIYKTQIGKKALLELTPYGKLFKNKANNEDDFYGLVTSSDKKAIVFLHAINNSDNPQLVNLESRECSESTPTASLITAFVHETIHRDAMVSSNEIINNKLSSPLKHGFESILDGEDEIEGVYNLGFNVLVTKVEGLFNSEEFSGLEEFVTHYMTTQLLTKNGIPTLTVSDRAPQAIINFERILNQAGISLEELKDMHSNSRLEDFLIRIAEGSKGVKLNSDEKKLKFGFDLFTPLFRNEKEWQGKFENYYDVDLTDHNEEPFSDGLIYKGCGVPFVDGKDLASTR